MLSKRELAFETTRTTILDAAMALFREKGFDGTTMRDIATAADVALGATYHYFKSKDDIVMVFYQDLLGEEAGWLETPEYQALRKPEERIRYCILKKLDQLSAHRAALEGVFRKASDPLSPLSPFSTEMRAIREGNIALFKRMLQETEHSFHEEFISVLPRILWLYQMGILMTWFYDRSPGQARSRFLLEISLLLFLRTLETLSLPLMGGFRRSVLTLVQTFDQIMEEPA